MERLAELSEADLTLLGKPLRYTFRRCLTIFGYSMLNILGLNDSEVLPPDWHSRKVLGWAVSNTMGVDLCLSALNQALVNTGRIPEIFNTDQGSQFTSTEWIDRLEELGIRISMDGKGRWMDNVFIERLWRSVKYEDIYLNEYPRISDQRSGLKKWFTRYNEWRPHEALGNETPSAIYGKKNSGDTKSKAA